MVTPYIGVASVTTANQARALIQCLPARSPIKVGIGVGVTSKTLAGKLTDHPNRLLPFREIKNVFVKDDRALNLVHFSTDEPGYLLRDIIKIYELVSSQIDGIQINLEVPDADQIEGVWTLLGNDVRIIWQVRLRSLKFTYAHALLRRYEPYISDILLDVSLGRGVTIDRRTMAEYSLFAKQVKLSYPKIGIGVAGGISAETIPELTSLFNEVGPLSLDAEGKLRDNDDCLDMTKARAYLKAAQKLYS